MSNWIKTNIEMPKEGATCLVTTQGDIALAKYSEGTSLNMVMMMYSITM